jgi:solute:Na+ symporter, SSS family
MDSSTLLKIGLTLLYVTITLYLGHKGWRETKDGKDYLIAGRSMGAFVMAMSYGATFISTSAIIGFGGAAALFGFPLLWLTFLNIFVGIFIAMVVLGRRVRRLGLAVDAHTFPELIGRRYNSPFLQGFGGLVIFLFLPIYAGAVLIGLARLVEVIFSIPYSTALLLCTFIVALYVLTGGLKAVMYTDAFQACVMFVVMAVFLIGTYYLAGGVISAHQALTDMVQYYPASLKAQGMLGWTQGITFWSQAWLTVYTTIVLGVGIGVLAQPQLAVRMMTVRNDAQLKRAVLYGGVFILCMTGVAFVVGALTNVIFFQKLGPMIQGKPAISVIVAGGNIDKIIPTYIDKMWPDYFGIIFMIAMFAAAMSTLSAQYHAGGTSLGRDFYKRALLGRGDTMMVTRVAVAVTILMTLIWAWALPESIIATATAFFFGLCSSCFLPALILGLFWRGMTWAGAVWSMVGGLSVSTLYALFIHARAAATVGLSNALFGVPNLVAGFPKDSFIWSLQYLDQNVVSLPCTFIIAVVVSLITKKYDQGHIDRCWRYF